MNKIKNIHILILLIFLISIGQMSQTIYVPSIFNIAKELKVNMEEVQKLMSGYLLCYGISQLIYGPISDKVGRKPVILVGMMIFILSTFLILFANSLELMIILFSIQGLGTGVGGVMARTLPRDIFLNYENLKKANGFLNMGILVSPLIAPLIGGIISNLFEWRMCFVFLLIIGILISTTIFIFLPETCTKKQIKNSIFGYKILIYKKKFNYYLLILTSGLSGIVVFESNSGVLLSEMGFSNIEVSILFILPIPSIFFGSWYIGFSKKSFNYLMWKSVILCLLSGFFMWLPGWFKIMKIWTILIPASLFFFSAGMLFPLATTGAMIPCKGSAGTAGALLGGIQNIGSSFIAFISTFLPKNGQFSIGMITFIIGVIIFLCWWKLSRLEKI
ncbi:emrD [Wigglesworthia glossinidia endosymbiont of Glossina brevipalpis]|uniref:EmrD protein n=1 Tax=Wigglesworthia glossinidia brevipalpis TaxID=36870 RepID=Q8D2S8_WIGBR|nr:emrD [Wigglesworthia glossinidia endosymbiont of Glossina brevipalpis]